jgi:hypothetical protein
MVFSLSTRAAAPVFAQQGGQRGTGLQGQANDNLGAPVSLAKDPVRPAPRSADGRALLGGGTPSERGVWLPVFPFGAPLIPPAQVPFQPWAKVLYEERVIHAMEPHARCKPSGGPRQLLTPYGVEFVELPEMQRVYIFDIGGPHTYRTIYMDGRPHPQTLIPSHYGHSIGWWTGDTLVVDSTGYNESFWIDRRGLPTTERLRTLERFTRTDSETITYEVTIDDPGAYTRPMTARFNLSREPNTELFEYICQEANYANELMMGQGKDGGRSSGVVP